MAILKDLLVNGPARILGAVFGTSFVKSGGTSSQFLKADGSVDSTSYEPELPSKTGNGGKVLAVNSGATGLEWVTQSGGGGTEDVFMCTFTSNNGTHSMDKTPEEIYQAVVASKKIAICKFNPIDPASRAVDHFRCDVSMVHFRPFFCHLLAKSVPYTLSTLNIADIRLIWNLSQEL